MLIDKIKADLKEAMMQKLDFKKNTLRMVLGEVPRLNKKAGEQPTDQEIEGIIRKLIKSETTTLEAIGSDPKNSVYILLLKEYLPVEMTKDEINKWILDNIDLSVYNPKIKAMKEILKTLKGKVNSNLVKEILMEIK